MTITLDPASLGWGIVLTVFLFGCALLFWVWRFMIRRLRASHGDRAEITERWQRIETLANAGDESSLRHALIEADNIFDLGMKLKFFSGKDFGGRLKMASARNSKLRRVWPAHILRNRLVHEPGTVLSAREAARAIAVYRDALKELGLL